MKEKCEEIKLSVNIFKTKRIHNTKEGLEDLIIGDKILEVVEECKYLGRIVLFKSGADKKN